jgi:hypothetical protein
VKSRNLSSNRIYDNTFTRAGRTSYYRGEFCDRQCAIDNDMARQCASIGDRFFNNKVNTGYSGGRISNWSLSPAGLTYSGVARPAPSLPVSSASGPVETPDQMTGTDLSRVSGE